jgi:hypothetical protein
VEVNFGIAFACLHAMKPVMAYLFPSLFNSSGNAQPIRRIPDRLVNDTSISSSAAEAMSLAKMPRKDMA